MASAHQLPVTVLLHLWVFIVDHAVSLTERLVNVITIAQRRKVEYREILSSRVSR